MDPDAGTRRANGLAAVLCLLAVALTVARLRGQLDSALWLGAALHPAGGDVAQLSFHFGTLPRLAVAALCGAGLALAGAICQHVLSNPLASPTTLGISSGAQLALAAATIFAPSGLGGAPQAVALAGGLASLSLVFVVASAQGFSSLALILSGLCVGLFCGALGGILKLYDQDYLGALFLWGAGSLEQTDWSVARTLAPRLAVLALAAALLLRPLRVLGLADESARSLGVSLALYRTAALGVALGLAASVTAAVGMIGFVEIAAPLVARLAGARRLGHRLLLAALIGAALMTIVDGAVQSLGQQLGAALPTGAATAVLGAPLLIWMLPRLRPGLPATPAGWAGGARSKSPLRLLAWLAAIALAVVVLAVVVGRTGTGWVAMSHQTWAALAPWRLPRTAEAFAAGAMLGTAGALLQRCTGNPMASPEILGIGAAAVAGFAVVLLLDPAPSGPVLFAAGSVGALALSVVLTGAAVRSGFTPDRMLLTGVALSAALDAVAAAVLALNDGRAGLLLGWMSGSTANADAGSALALCALACLLVTLPLVFCRSLDLLSLGDPVARGLGVSPGPTRAGLMLLSGLLTAGAVLAVGPLTFVGLIGPHVASRLGLRRSAVHVPGAALIGGLVMAAADWIGRVADAPFDLPAGLVASLIGVPYLVLQLRRRASRSIGG